MRQWLTIGVACLGLLANGCFIFEEIDSGMATMKKHSPPSATAVEKPEAESGLSFADLKERGAEVMMDLSGRVEEALKKEPDAANGVVRCATEGRVEFTRAFDCQSRGGRIASQ